MVKQISAFQQLGLIQILLFTVGFLFYSVSGKPSSVIVGPGNQNPSSLQAQTNRTGKSFKGTPLWNSHHISLNARVPYQIKREYYGYGPHKIEPHGTHQEFIKALHEFIGVMGPFLFAFPYLFAMLPLAIPAIPLALWFDRTNGAEGHHPPEHPPMHDNNGMNTTTSHMENSHNVIISVVSSTIPPITTTTTAKTTTTTKPTTVKTTTGKPPPIITMNPSMVSMTNFTISSSNSSSSIGGPPPIDLSPPQTPPLYPFPLFLNSSWLAIDYTGEQNWEQKSN